MTAGIILETRARVRAHKGRYRELAALTDLSESYISKFARGERGDNPRMDTLDRLTGALDEIEKSKASNDAGTADVQ